MGMAMTKAHKNSGVILIAFYSLDGTINILTCLFLNCTPISFKITSNFYDIFARKTAHLSALICLFLIIQTKRQYTFYGFFCEAIIDVGK